MIQLHKQIFRVNMMSILPLQNLSIIAKQPQLNNLIKMIDNRKDLVKQNIARRSCTSPVKEKTQIKNLHNIYRNLMEIFRQMFLSAVIVRKFCGPLMTTSGIMRQSMAGKTVDYSKVC